MNRFGVYQSGKTGANRFWFGEIGRDENAWGKHIKAIPRYAKVGQDKLFHTSFQANAKVINRLCFLLPELVEQVRQFQRLGLCEFAAGYALTVHESRLFNIGECLFA